jgi:UDP-2-acetamido-3-amino-2,3-dideoxy-glucuronate N-acetyltransferase
VVTKDVPAYAVVYGNPARQHGWACQCGKVLAFRGDQAECPDCHRQYRRIDDRTIELASEARNEAA